MKKRLLALVLTICLIVGLLPMTAFAAESTEIVFELGANGSASHADGTSKTTYSETVGAYTLSLTNGTSFYTGARDAKGNSCIKLGTSSKTGSFKFTVPDAVTSVIIAVAKYKANTTKVSVNGTNYTISGASNNGAYDAIEVDTSVNKNISFTTVSGGVRAMVNSITYVIETSDEPECEHEYTPAITTEPGCTTTGVKTYTCSKCEHSYTEEVAALGHQFGEDGTCTGCGAAPYQLVTDTTMLADGAKVIVAAKNVAYAMGTAGSNNRTQASITKGEGTALFGEDVQVITLVKDESGYWAMMAGTSYLYAASSSANSLKTQTTNDANGLWDISIAADGTATIVAQGTNSRKIMRYNSQSSLFSCYASGQDDIVLYADALAKGCAHVWGEPVKEGIYEVSTCTNGCGETQKTFVMPEEGDALSISDAIDLGKMQANNAYTEEKFYVTGTIKNVYNTQYGNMYITDGEHEFIIYGLYNFDGSVRYDAMEQKPVAGDEITVYGIVGNYNGTPQMKNGWLDEVIHEHAFGEGVVTEPNCKDAGYTTYTCACGYKKTEAGADALGHDWSDATYETPKTCSVCGATEGEALVAVAKVGNDYVGTWEEALEAWDAGETLTMLADIEMSEILVIDKAGVTLNGNGHTLTSTAARAINVAVDGYVLIHSLTINASGERGINVITYPAELELDSVFVTAANYALNLATSAGAADVVIYDSSFTGLNVINVAAPGATVDISSDTYITCNDQNAAEHYSALALNKDAVGAVITVSESVTFEIKGDSKIASNGAENGQILIGGEEAGEKVVAIIEYEGSDNYYSFTSLQAALDAAKDGETVKLLANVELSKYADIYTANNGEVAREITLDLNGKTISPAADYKYSDYALVFVGLNQTLNITGAGTITADKGVTVGVYGVLNLVDATIVNNGTTDDDGAIDVYYFTGNDAYPDEAAGKATISGGTVDGTLWAGGDVTITGGTIDNLNVYAGDTTVSGGAIATVDAAAQIGNTYYGDLQAAIDAAQPGDTIVLIDDIALTETVVIPADKTITLDLNGKTVSMAYVGSEVESHQMIHNKGNLTIQDTAGNGKLSYEYTGVNLGTSKYANTITSDYGSVLTVKSGTIKNLTYDDAIIAYAIDGLTNGNGGDVTVNIEGGTISSLRQAIRIFANSTTKTGTLNISGGDITGRVIIQNASASANKAALSITGGTFTANEYKTDVLYVGGNNGATIDMAPVVSGGTFKGDITSSVGTGFITGGTYTSDVTEFLADGYVLTGTEGAYGVEADPTYGKVAQIGDQYFITLADAAAAAQNGDEIVLLTDTAETGTIEIPAGVTLNGNGKVISAATIKAGGDLTFKGQTTVSGFSAGWYNNTITIGEGASLKVTGGRVTVSYGNVINVIGSVADAKTADKTTITPSLELVGGISFTGAGGDVQLNVTNAYVKLGDSTTKNSAATGKFNVNFTNSIVDFTKTLKTYMPTASGLAPEFNFAAKDSVVSFASHLELWLDGTTMTLDNTDLTVGGSFANAGDVVVENNSNFVVKAPIMSSHGGNTGSIEVTGGTFELVDSNVDWENAGTMTASGTGKLITNDFKNVGEGKLVLASATASIVGKADLGVITNLKDFNVTFADGAYTLIGKVYVAQIGEEKYESFAGAVNAIATDGSDTTIKLLTDIELSESIEFNYGTGKVIFTADEPVTVKQVKVGLDLALTKALATTVVVDENVTFELYDNASGMYLYYGPSLELKGTIVGGQNWGCLYLFNGEHIVTETGKIGVGRVQLGFSTTTVYGTVDTNYLLVEGATFIADGATIDANVIYDNNNGGQRWGASTFVIKNGAVVNAGTVTLSYADSVLSIDPTSKLTATAIKGAGKIIIDATGLTEGEVTFITGDASGFTGTIEVIGNDNLVGRVIGGKITLVERELEGEGTADAPYLINNLNDLILFRDKVDKQLSDGTSQYAGKYFKLTADIDLAGINWNPIGSMTGDHGSFLGVFDGNGHTISNLTVEQAGNGLGLFARTAGNAEIKNLTLNNVTVKSTDNSNYVGGLVGNAYANTKITNVHVTGDIDISGRGYIGGISGHGYVVMDNVSVVGTGTISSTFWCAGGILGYGGEGVTSITNAHVEGITIKSAAGGLGAIVGMAEDNGGTQPISGANLSAKNVVITTYTGAYGDAYADYALGYLYGGNETSILTGNLVVENVQVKTSTGAEPTIVDAVALVGDGVYFNIDAAWAAAQSGNEVKILKAGSYTVPAGKDITITGAVDGVVFENIGAHNMGGANVTFNNVTFNYATNSTYKGLQHSGNLVYNDCTFNGQVFLYGTSETFNNCTFNTTDAANYNVWTYGAKEVAFNDCTFNSAGKSVLIYQESAGASNDVTVTNCEFVASAPVDGKAAIEMDSSLAAGITLTVENTTATGFGNGNVSGNSLWNNKKGNEGVNNDITVTVDDVVVLQPIKTAQIGDVYYTTIDAAIAAAEAGQTVTIMAGDYTQNLSVNKAITVIGETDAEGNNLVTINGKLSVSGADVTVKNLNVNNPTGNAGVISGGNILVEGCNITGKNGFRDCYANNGDVTLKNCVITGSIYGVHFDAGNGEGNVIIEGCTITGWTSFGSAIEEVTITDTTFKTGNYNVLRFYQNAEVTNTTFPAGMRIDSGSGGVGMEGITINFTDCTLTGGELVDAFPESVLAMSAVYENGVRLMPVCATVNGVEYRDLQAAINAANAGDTVILVRNVELTEGLVVAADDEIVLDLNGMTVSMADASGAAAQLIKNNGTLTIKDSAEGGKLTFVTTTPSATNSYSCSTISNCGNLTIESGIIENTTAAGACYAIDNAWYTDDVSLTVKGGTVKAAKIAIRQTLFSATAKNTIVIEGGVVEGEFAGLQIHNYQNFAALSDVTISGGTFNGSYAFYTSYSYNNTATETDITVSGGTFNGAVYVYNGKAGSSEYGMGDISVTGGTFNGEFYVYTKDAAGNAVANSVVSGGSYSEGNVEDYLVDGCGLIYKNGMFHVVVDPVASVAGKDYASLQAAIDAAEANGATIYLKKDIVLKAPVTVDGTVELDLNGYNISYTTSVLGEALIVNNGDLTVIGEGKITYTYTGAADPNYTKTNATILNNGTLTIMSGTIENTTASMALASYAINTGAGATLNVEGGQILNLNGHAIRQVSFGTAANTVNISGGYIEGTRAIQVQLPGGASAAAPEMTLNITGGELKSNDATYNLAVYIYSGGQSAEDVAMNVSGDAVLNGDVAFYAPMVENGINITGGTFNGSYGVYGYNSVEEDAPVISITGGTFVSNYSEQYATDDGFVFETNDNGSYTAVKKTLFTIDTMRMQLNNELQADFAFAESKLADWTGCYAIVTQQLANGEIRETVIESNAWFTVDGYVGISYSNIAAKEMTDKLTIVIYNGDHEAISEAYTDTLAAYAGRAFKLAANKGDVKGQYMYVNMLYYGAAAQNAMNYNTTDLATDYLTDAMKDFVTANGRTTADLSAKVVATVTGEHAEYYTNSRAILESNIQLQVGFAPVVYNAGYTATYSYIDHLGKEHNDVAATITAIRTTSGSVQFAAVTMEELVIADCGEEVTVKLYDADGNLVITVVDSVENFATRMSNSESAAETQKVLAQEIMNFSISAYEFLHK